MTELQTFSREGIIRKLSMAVVLILMAIPLVISWQYNLSHSGTFFLRAAVFLLLALVLLWRLCLHIHTGWIRHLVAVVGMLSLAVFSAGRLASFYFQGESFNEEYFFHVSPETTAFALTAFRGLIFVSIAYLLLCALAGYFAMYKADVIPLANRTLMVPPALLLVLAMDPDISRWAVNAMTNSNAGATIQLSNIDWEGLGLDRNALYRVNDEITAGKNVVMIYLEGLEHMYTEPDIFPGLTPFLTSLEDQGLHFEHMYQSRGATFTVAGILSSQCGTPLLFPQGPGGNDILKNGFLQEGFCFGDILKSAGYHQVFMGGASTRFAGKGVFLADHGYDEVLGKEELQPLMEDPQYLNNWGLYDDTLLALATDKFDELAANANQPFNFTVLTVDTHPPGGTVSSSCEPYSEIDNSIFHAIHCTDQLVARFVDHLKQSPAWPNTVVLLMSDHLHMRNTGMDHYPEDYDRRLLVNILNAGKSGIIEARGVHMDVAPTLLNLMGVRHRQAFLAGSDMLAPDKDERWVNPDSGVRERTIRYLNTNLLSRIETGLCEANPLYSYSDNTLRVAGREIDLSLRGRSLPLQSVGREFVLVTLVSREGRVGLTFPVSIASLPYVMFQFRDYNFLILAPQDTIKSLDPATPSLEGLGLVFGNLEQSFQTLQTGLSFNQGFEIDADCGELLDQSRMLTDAIDMDSLSRICEYRVPEGNVLREDEGLLSLTTIAYADQRFQAEFKRNNQGWYSVTSLNELPPVPEPESCDAYYGNMEILIPSVQAKTGPASVILKKVPGVTLTFELEQVAPFPEARQAN